MLVPVTVSAETTVSIQEKDQKTMVSSPVEINSIYILTICVFWSTAELHNSKKMADHFFFKAKLTMRSCRQLRLLCWRSAVERPPCRKRTSTLPAEIQGTQLPLTLVKTTLHLLAFFFFFLVRYMLLASIQIMSGIQICLTSTMGSKFYQFSSVQFKVIPMRLGKPICVPPHLSGVSPLLPLKHQWSWSRGIKRGIVCFIA